VLDTCTYRYTQIFPPFFTSIDESYSNVATKLRTHSHYMHIKPSTEASVDESYSTNLLLMEMCWHCIFVFTTQQKKVACIYTATKHKFSCFLCICIHTKNKHICVSAYTQRTSTFHPFSLFFFPFWCICRCITRRRCTNKVDRLILHTHLNKHRNVSVFLSVFPLAFAVVSCRNVAPITLVIWFFLDVYRYFGCIYGMNTLFCFCSSKKN